MPPDAGGTHSDSPPSAQIQTKVHEIGFDPKAAVPQQPIYLEDNDNVAFTIFTNSTPAQIQLTYRYLTPKGEIKQGLQIFTTAGAINSFNFTLGNVWLISFGLQRVSPTGQNVITFVQALMIRDQLTGAGQNIYGIIWQGFVQVTSGNGWPGTPAKEITDSPGNIRTLVGSFPAAGVEISETVPLFRRWILLSFETTLISAVAAANRNVSLVFDDGASKFYIGPSFFNQVASTTVFYSLIPSLPGTPALGLIQPLVAPLPIPLRGGFRIKTQTANIQAADQWAAPIYSFLEWGSWDS
jgi:hypothetical protein